MGIFSKDKKKDELMLVFNIGSSHVGGALFLAQKSGIPKIIFSVREPILVEEKVNIDRFLALTLKSLGIVRDKIYRAGKGAPSGVFCVLASPWYVSETRIISLKKNSPFIFNEKLADELIQKEIKIFEEEHSEKYAKVGNAVRSIELKNIKTTLNGYETAKPLDQKAKQLEMTIFISISAEEILSKIENTIAKRFHFNQIKFSSFAIASFTVVRNMYEKQENFLLVDVGGEVTDITMIKNNVLRESVSFPLGCNFLAREAAIVLGSTLHEADSLISLFKDGHAEESVSEKLSIIMNDLRAKWLRHFQESLAVLSNDISIPATVYISIDRDLADFFAETIKTEQFSQYTLTESKFEVTFLSSELFHGLAQFEDKVVREPFLIIDSVYINRFLIKS
jgi:hypothetical protein